MKITIDTPYCFSQLGTRNNQEDSFFPKSPSDQDNFLMVCDGVGGLDAGEKASDIVCRAFDELLTGNINRSDLFTIEDFERVLKYAYNELKRSNIGTAATTMTFVCLNSRGIFAAHIGDSRIYQIRKGSGIVFRSHDHSLVAEYVKAGMITERQAEVHPQRNIITRAMSGERGEDGYAMATVNYITDVRPGDMIVLCTDGVYGETGDDVMVDILTSDMPLSEKCDTLAKACVDSNDNNTAYIIRIKDVEGAEQNEIHEENIDYDTSVQTADHHSLSDKIERFFNKLFGAIS